MTPATWMSSPWCEAQAMAICSSLSSNFSMAPEVTSASASAWTSRPNAGRPGDRCRRPRAMMLPIRIGDDEGAPRWRFSTQLPRTVSARIGLASMKNRPPCYPWDNRRPEKSPEEVRAAAWTAGRNELRPCRRAGVRTSPAEGRGGGRGGADATERGLDRVSGSAGDEITPASSGNQTVFRWSSASRSPSGPSSMGRF